MAASPSVEIEVGGRTVRVTNPDRTYFPETGWTKRDLVEYYLSVGDGIVRALRERPPEAVAAAAIAFITGPLADNPQRVGGLLRSWRVDGEIATAALGQVERQSAVGTSAHGPSRAAGTTATPSSGRRYA